MPNHVAPTYLVRRSPGDFEVTGKGSSPAWQHTDGLADFCYPWETEMPAPTKFRALHSARWVYFLFDVEDRQTHVDVISNDKREVIDSSRVEIFFRKDEQMTPYYCLELDAAGRVLDYRGEFHRHFEFDWAWPANELIVRATLRPEGYTIEAAVSIDSLRRLGLLTAGQLQAGLFRAECTRTVVPRDHMRWISWVRPESPSPDFHIPSAFGLLSLEGD